MQTLTLPEYGTLTDVALESADVGALATFSPSQLAVSPTLHGDGYDLSASSWVGTIRTPGLSLMLEPKIPISRLLFLLSYTLDPTRWRDVPFDYETAPSLVEAVIPGFVHQVRRAVQLGLLQGYQRREDTLTTVRGRIDFSQQLRRHHGRAPPVEVAYDEFTDDITENRLLKAAIHRLGQLQLRSSASRGALRTLASAFGRISLVPYDPRRLPEVTYTRLNRHYRPAVELARLILQATSVDVAHGGRRSSAFLVDMNSVFEAFVTVALREALDADERTFPTPDRAPRLQLDDERRISLRPDLTWLHSRRRVFVGDVKYKRIAPTSSPNADLYQALAYTVATGLPDAMLIYAAGEADNGDHPIAAIGKQLRVRTLDVSAPPEQILAQTRSLASEIRSIAAPTSHPTSSRFVGPRRRTIAGRSHDVTG